MSPNQRSQGNNQTDNGANEQSVSSSRGGTIGREHPDEKGQQRSGMLGQQNAAQAGQEHGGIAGRQSGTQSGQNASAGAMQKGTSGEQSISQDGQQEVSRMGQQPNAQSGLQPASQGGMQQGGQLGQQSGVRQPMDSTDRTGSETGAGAAQHMQPVHESNDAAGSYPKSPGGANKLAADQKMDDDTGFSNTAPELDEGTRQMEQSNVGRRGDMTPD